MFKKDLGEVKRSGAIFVKSEMGEGFVIHQPTDQVSHLRTFSHFAFSEEEKSVCSIFGFAQLVAIHDLSERLVVVCRPTTSLSHK